MIKPWKWICNHLRTFPWPGGPHASLWEGRNGRSEGLRKRQGAWSHSWTGKNVPHQASDSHGMECPEGARNSKIKSVRKQKDWPNPQMIKLCARFKKKIETEITWLKVDVLELWAVAIVPALPPHPHLLSCRGIWAEERQQADSWGAFSSSCSSSPSFSMLPLTSFSPAASQPLPHTWLWGFLSVVLQQLPLELCACDFSPSQSILRTQVKATTTLIPTVKYTAPASSPHSPAWLLGSLTFGFQQHWATHCLPCSHSFGAS